MKAILSLFVFAFGCGRLSTPTEPPMTQCTNPARLVISVTPLQDPEGFVIDVDEHYALSSVAQQLREIPGVTSLQLHETTHFIGANLRPSSVDAVRCVPGVIGVEQGRTNIPPP